MKKLVNKIKDTLSILHSSKGFTLIEILVVVLIIGILAAIALPQYKFAVEKTKLSKYLTIGQSIRNAQERYYMVMGEYSASLANLDIDIESLCESRAGDYQNIFYNCVDKSIELDNAVFDHMAIGVVGIEYCSSLGSIVQNSWHECSWNKDLEIDFYYANFSDDVNLQNKIICNGKTNKGKRLCKALGY